MTGHCFGKQSPTSPQLPCSDECTLLATGIHPLTPSLVDLINQQVKQSMKDLPRLHLLIKASFRLCLILVHQNLSSMTAFFYDSIIINSESSSHQARLILSSSVPVSLDFDPSNWGSPL